MREEIDDRAAVVAERAQARGWTVACAESLTSGAIASALGAAENASEWFRGGVVAYASGVKHDLLHVPPGPVVSAPAARAMAHGAARLLDADLVVAVTGAGGPDPQDGQPPGTVWFGVFWPGGREQTHRAFSGEPVEVVQQTVAFALGLLGDVLARDT